MSSADRLYRLFQIVEFLQSGESCNSTSLAVRLGGSRRTIFRDIDALKNAGVNIQFDDKRQAFLLLDKISVPASEFTTQEALSLLVLCRQLGQSGRGVPFYEHARSAANKLQKSLPKHLRRMLSPLIDSIEVHLDSHNSLDGSEEIYEIVTTAVGERKKVRLKYGSLFEQENITTLVSPYRLMFLKRSWYVVGRSSIHRAVRTFNVGRILKAELVDSKYTVPARFSLDRYLRNAWQLIREPGKSHKVEIRFTKKVASNVAEIRWHKTQSIKKNRDGSITFKADVDGLGEIIWWILGYGSSAEVIKPAKLRSMVREHAELMMDLYKVGPKRSKRKPGAKPKKRRQSKAKR